MGVISVLSHVKTCYNSADGEVIRRLLEAELRNNAPVTVSFKGVNSVPSSFVNSALVSLLRDFSFDQIRNLVRFSDTNSQINEMIRSRLTFEAKKERVH